ncbi:erythromycin esterase family protein [Massilia sp. YMA4]|uniref:erythromycin esterase family protein n=1 Tax=Massilia sp. YMA4 TaxID=1593482 RepID=UPI001877B8E0|nr:erythromycin esterase family protein [Massilia sp. YMA4]
MTTVHPDGANDDDLKPFADAIGTARVVALAEQTHGGSEEFLLKTRLLKYLHEKMGFDVLLLESGFYEMGRLAERAAQGEKLDDMAPGNVFFMYANSAEGRGMLQYLDRQRALGKPMLVAGIDSQHTGVLSNTELLPRLQAYLRQRAPALAAGTGWQAYAQAAAPLFAQQRTAPEAAVREAFRRHGTALQEALCGTPDGTIEGPGWWCRIVRSIDAQATTYWSGGSNYQRDNAMGANAIWLADHMFPGKKVVVWAHTIHVARGFQRAADQLQAGEVMHRHWGPAYKVVQMSAAHGAIVDFNDMRTLPLPKPAAASLEYRLSQRAESVLGVTAQVPLSLPQHSFDYGLGLTGMPGQLGRNWDVLFFTREIRPVRMTR